MTYYYITYFTSFKYIRHVHRKDHILCIKVLCIYIIAQSKIWLSMSVRITYSLQLELLLLYKHMVQLSKNKLFKVTETEFSATLMFTWSRDGSVQDKILEEYFIFWYHYFEMGKYNKQNTKFERSSEIIKIIFFKQIENQSGTKNG